MRWVAAGCGWSEGKASSDADAAVLERQLRLRESLTADEDALVLKTDTGTQPLEKCVARAGAMLEGRASEQ